MSNRAFISMLLAGLATLFVLAPAGPGHSAEPAELLEELAGRVSRRVAPSPEEQAWLDAGHTVRVRLAEIPPYHYSIEGQPHGISVDYLRVVFAAFKIRHQFMARDGVSFSEAFASLGRGESYDLMPTVRRSPEREGMALYTRDYIFTPWVIYTRNTSAFVGSVSDLDGKTVAVEGGYLVSAMLARDYPRIRLVEFSNSQLALESLALGKTDAYVGDLSVGTFIIQRHGYTNVKVAAPTDYPPISQVMGVRRDWPELASLIDKSLLALTQDEVQQITNKSTSVRFDYGVDWQMVRAIIAGILGLAGLVVWVWNRRLQSEIVERKQAAAELRASQALLSSIIDNTSDWVWSVDPRSFGLLIFNKQLSDYYLRDLGIRIHAGMTPWQMLPREAAERWEGYYRRALNSESFQMEYQTVGGFNCLLLSFDTVYRDGQPIHIIVFGKNVTERKRMEELQAEIEAIVKHDLRSPASSAITVAQLLREELELTDENSRLLELLEQSGRNMLDTLDSSIVLYKIETGRFVPEPMPQDCLGLVRQTVEMLGKVRGYEDRRVHLLCNGEPVGPETTCTCRCDSRLFRTVLYNLLCNALEAAPDGSDVRVSLAVDGQCDIEIRNKGVVPKAIRSRFFEKYVTEGKSKGTGIGTYSAKLMLEAQGGAVSMRTSDDENETVVTIVLPRG